MKTIDGLMLKEMFLSGAANINANRESVDALNVFPVPDGDTGTNMCQTMNSAVTCATARSPACTKWRIARPRARCAARAAIRA